MRQLIVAVLGERFLTDPVIWIVMEGVNDHVAYEEREKTSHHKNAGGYGDPEGDSGGLCHSSTVSDAD